MCSVNTISAAPSASAFAIGGPHELGGDGMDDRRRRSRSRRSAETLATADGACDGSPAMNATRLMRILLRPAAAGCQLLHGNGADVRPTPPSILSAHRASASADEGSSASAFCTCGSRCRAGPSDARYASASAHVRRRVSRLQIEILSASTASRGRPRAQVDPADQQMRLALRTARGTRRGAVRSIASRSCSALEQPAAAIEMELRDDRAGRAARR